VGTTVWAWAGPAAPLCAPARPSTAPVGLTRREARDQPRARPRASAPTSPAGATDPTRATNPTRATDPARATDPVRAPEPVAPPTPPPGPLASTAVLPDWPPGTVTVLATAGPRPHAIPVSAAVRAGPRHALVALAGGRRSLSRLRADPNVALTVLARDLAVTAHGRARIVDEALVEGVVAIEIEVEDVQDHDRPTFAIESGVRWRWTEPEARERDGAVHAALVRLARSRPADP